MSQEKTTRNRQIYLDKIKVKHGKDTTWRKLQEKWGLSINTLRTIVEREHSKTLK